MENAAVEPSQRMKHAAVEPSQWMEHAASNHRSGKEETCMMPRVLRLRGSPEEMGRQHGHLLKGEIHERLRSAWAWWRRYAGNGHELRYLRLAHRMVADFKRHGGTAWEEWQALAKAAQVSPEELILLTAWHDWAEVVHASVPVAASVGGCTAAILCEPVVPCGSWLAMNWDTPNLLGRHLHIFYREPEDGPGALALAAAGGLPIAGINEAGLAFVWVDRAYRDAEPRLPSGAICCDLVHITHFDAAVQLARTSPVASGLGLALSDASGHTVLLEIGPQSRAEHLPTREQRILVFANHYQAETLQSQDGWPNRAASQARQQRLAARLQQLASPAEPKQIRQCFADHEPLAGESLCQHGQQSQTCTSAFVLAIAEREELWVNFGPPCQNQLVVQRVR
jgi:hypothetical protein